MPGILEAIGGLLGKSAAPFLMQKGVPKVLEHINRLKGTYILDSIADLKQGVKEGLVKQGTIIESRAFLSPYALSGSLFRPSMQLGGMAANMMQTVLTGQFSNTYLHVLPYTKFPLVNDDYRVAFLYPVTFAGFGIPIIPPPGTLPFLQGQVCLIHPADLLKFGGGIVDFRARVIELPISIVKEVFPGISDDVCENLHQNGSLVALAFDEMPPCNLETHGRLGHDQMGAIYLETHWDSAVGKPWNEFLGQVDKSLREACESAGIPQPQGGQEQVSENYLWYGHAYSLTCPKASPYISLQANISLEGGPERDQSREAFEQLSSELLRQMSEVYDVPNDVPDVDGVTDYDATKFSVLNSDAARQLDDPVFKILVHWLQSSPKK